MVRWAAAATIAAAGVTGYAGDYLSPNEAQVKGVGPWKVLPLFTVGETIDGYTPPGVLDGIGAATTSKGDVNVLVNHELGSSAGYPYPLANGTWLKGGRISSFVLDPDTLTICWAGPAYHTIVDRAGLIVEGGATAETATNGINRPCSARSVMAGEYGFVDDIFFSGEETDGGTEFALDVASGVLHAAPALGVAAWENVTPIAPPAPGTVALIIGDDRDPAPLLLYIGHKNAIGNGGFLDRNGLAVGQLFVWVADSGVTTPEQFNGSGNTAAGTFVEIDYYRPDLAGVDGYDAMGYASQGKQDALAIDAGAFLFSRPEDVHDNPADAHQFVMTSTGRGQLYPSDNWGTIYTFKVSYNGQIKADAHILYDADDADHQDFGIRSPDNLVWAEDGYIYVQEDKSTSPGSLFGAASGVEASMWRLDPKTGKATRTAIVNRSAALPDTQTNGSPAEIGNWETSGVLDLTSYLNFPGNQTILIADVQAHSVTDGSIAAGNLSQGGQLVLISNGKGPLRSKLAKGKHKK